MEDIIVLDIRKNPISTAETALYVNKYVSEHPEEDVVFDGDRHALVAKRRYHV